MIQTQNPRRAALIYFGLTAALVVLDQIVKLAVKLNMELGDEVELLGSFFKLHFIENPGAAFGMTVNTFLGSLTDETAKLILTLFSLLAVGALAVAVYRTAGARTRLPLFLTLILGGAVGNIIDRVFYGVWFADINLYDGGLLHGRVVDMFYFDVWQGFLPSWIPLWGGQYISLWPIFNIADIAITFGIGAILLYQKTLFAHTSLGAKPPAPQAAPSAE